MIMDQAVRAESIVWPLNGVAVMSASYAQEDERFDRIYSKSKQQQWNVDDYDWTYELDADNPSEIQQRLIEQAKKRQEILEQLQRQSK